MAKWQPHGSILLWAWDSAIVVPAFPVSRLVLLTAGLGENKLPAQSYVADERQS